MGLIASSTELCPVCKGERRAQKMVDGKECINDFHPEATKSGMHRAVCIAIVDLGMQETEYQGVKKDKRQVAFIYELDQEFTRGNFAGERMLVSEILTLSLNEKATLRARLESWRGKRLSDQELRGYDILEWNGAPGMINVVHNTKGYAKIGSIAPMMSGLDVLQPNRLNYVPQWIKDIANRGEGGQKFSDEEDTGEPSFF